MEFNSEHRRSVRTNVSRTEIPSAPLQAAPEGTNTSIRRTKAVSAPVPIASSSAEVQATAKLLINAATILPSLSNVLKGPQPQFASRICVDGDVAADQQSP